MNAENFADYLNDYSKLYQLSYEELKSLVLQYPYCSNLHYLLVEKSQLDQHKDLEQNIRTASFYSQDRATLRRILQKLQVVARQMESFELAEDYLELKDLSAVEQEVESLTTEDFLNVQEENEDSFPDLFSALSDDSKEPETFFTEDDGEDELSKPLTPEEVNTPANEEQEELAPEKAGESLEELFDHLMNQAGSNSDVEGSTELIIEENVTEKDIETSDSSPILQEESINQQAEDPPVTEIEVAEIEEKAEKTEDVMETPKDPMSQPTPTPKSSFTSWVQQFQPTHVKVQLGELMESKKREDAKQARKKKKKKKKKDKVVIFAERSLKERPDLASETLAELLVAQEQYDKAIEMYKRLILKFPEKSSYFADKIKNLKNE